MLRLACTPSPRAPILFFLTTGCAAVAALPVAAGTLPRDSGALDPAFPVIIASLPIRRILPAE